MNKHSLVMALFFFIVSCKTVEKQGAMLQGEMPFSLETCDHDEFSLVGRDDVRRIARRTDEMKKLADQCRRAGALHLDRIIDQNRFICDCVAVAIDATLFSDQEKKKNSHSHDVTECQRHTYWQGLTLCRWNEGTARTLGEVRERDSAQGDELSLDSQRDEYHNQLGRRLAAAYLQTHAKVSRMHGCRSLASSLALYSYKEGLCVRLEQNKMHVESEEKVREKIKEFAGGEI